ncbi:MAG: C1 family peptidase [Coprobacillus sp.]|nr:C1 family peptidase [Coprobacillus sp.]
MTNEIQLKDIEKYSKAFHSEEKNTIYQDTVIKNGIGKSSVNPEARNKLYNDSFSINLDAGRITDQQRSGRCWMFAATNVLRLEVMKNLNIDNMELSQAYLFFWDKLEKSNFFLENVLRTLEEPLGSRLLDFLLTDPLGDGGQWTMICNLISKYGVVPKTVYPETASSAMSMEMDRYLTLLLRSDACEIRNSAAKGTPVETLRGRKDKMLCDVYRILCFCLGEPPKTFDYEYVDKEKKYHCISGTTPQQFFKDCVKVNLDDYVSILNCPSPLRPLNTAITVDFLNNVEGGNPVVYLNLPMKRLKELVLKQLKDGQVVWFGSDVSQYLTRDEGIMAPEAFDVDKLLGVKFNLNKGERVDYGESLMTHAMVITGVNINEKTKKVERWKIENSWGDKFGFQGFGVASDKWFDEFVFQAVINKKYLTEEELALLESEPLHLNPWDPMGSLAL